ncbi:hypothetical protein SLEP1_g48165 [Rubroshorea leprosula]|uniref:Flowering time control protein FCA n=1 Tax=Rubroshorea leprosula TaxID=152421 RepID=A0AAV5LTQ2_9ROSI|nr:hypothetical protein SLEP1_g48165 [Rubroshorea leprosula]
MERFRDHGNGYQDPHRNSQYPNSSSWPSNDQRPNFPGDHPHHHHRDHHHHNHHHNYHHYNHHFQPQFNHQPPQHQHHHPQQQPHHHQRHQFESFPDHQQAQHMGSEQNDPFWSNGGGSGGYNSGQKRSFHHSGPGASPDHPDGSGVAKLYVAPVPRTATEDDIRSLFKEHGNVVEVILPKDKKTGERQGYCFVKYLTFEEAGRAIKELDSQHTFPGELASIRVRYADADRDRVGTPHLEKIFVSGLSKQASRKEIEEIFSPYGIVEDIYIIRDDHGENRGCGFVQFSRREMALAAINALNGLFTMRGCDQPLIVKFAYPKKPRAGEPRANYGPNSLNSGCHTSELTMRPVPNFCNPMAGPVPPTVPYPVQQIPLNPQPQAFPPWANTGGAAPIVAQQSHPPLQAPLQPTQFPLQQTQPPWESSQSHQQSGSGVQKQIPPVLPTSQNFGQPQSSNVSKLESMQSASSQTIVTSSSSPTVPQNLEALATLECDWSEHTCPDGYKYYYNCVTLESTWDKPEEFALFEKQLQKQQKPQNPSQKLQSHLPVPSAEQVSQNEEVLDCVQVNSETSRLVGPTCV